tara:strand:- start:280 stop:468 length:189 start_codon:yes stop_codon:yes gene_type:complete
MILGYILTMVYISLQGDVEGKTLNYYITFAECHAHAVELELNAAPGIGYVCIEDTATVGERL